MEILRKDENQNLIINKEQDFLNDLGWQENMIQFEDEVLSTIINPIENYETVRYIHKPYNTTVSGLTFSQTDIWYNFYFVSGTSYTQDYNIVGIDTHENAKMLKQATQSFFRLEFYKTPHISGTTYEPPTRVNRKLSFAKNLSLPLGEKYFYTGNNINEDIFFPVFMGSNYRNKENMYLFWFQDESVLSETVLSGDTFWMTTKFFNANDGTILDFVNRPIYSNVEINEANDMYYKLVIDRTDYSYQYFRYTGTTGDRVGESVDSIKFYERNGIPVPTGTPTPTPTKTPTPTPSSTSTPTPTPSSTSTPTPTPTATSTATPTPTATVAPCNLTISSTQTTAPTNQEGTNGTSVITFTTTNGPSTYTLNGVSQGACISPLTIPNLSSSVQYTVVITDSNSCTAQSVFTLGQTTFTFSADYIMITYEFTDGQDLDTRTRIVTPDVGQDTQNEYIGYGCQSRWPLTGTQYLTWSGDNQGIGFESVLINLSQFSIQNPSITQILMDMRGFWFVTVGTQPVKVAATLWKGGTPDKVGYIWTNSTATSTYNIDSVGKQVTSQGLPDKVLSSGERIATLTYNLVTGVGSLDNNDTTTATV
jgi:hypothetical protein